MIEANAHNIIFTGPYSEECVAGYNSQGVHEESRSR